jgi:hypothetical protein
MPRVDVLDEERNGQGWFFFFFFFKERLIFINQEKGTSQATIKGIHKNYHRGVHKSPP